MASHQIFSVCRVFELDDSYNVLPIRRAKNGDLITQNEGGDNINTESTPHPRDYMSCFIKKKKPIRIQYLSITIASTA